LDKKFYTLEVKNLEKTTEDCTVVELNMPDTLKETFKFKQGQYLTFKSTIDNEEIRRSYSLCSSPLEEKWKVGIKKIPEGKFSTYANDVLKEGDVLQTMVPNGNFFVEIDSTVPRNYVAFAAGSGITPILSIIKTHLMAEPNAKFELFYVNKNTTSIILKEELEGLKNKFIDRLEINYFLTRQKRLIDIYNGRITKEKLSAIANKLCNFNEVSHFFICGPNEMIFDIKDFLEAYGVASNTIHFELFNTGNQKQIKRDTTPLSDYAGKITNATIIEGNKSYEIKLKTDIDTVLDAALANGAELPFACKGGVCCTCRAKLIEGEVEMHINYALEPEEIEEGYILTCQAIAKTQNIKVNFDE